MQIIRDVVTLRSAIAAIRSENVRVALVPTMGALHEGHMALVREARRHANHVIVSIFVNPTQFGPNEDLNAYPRQEAQDVSLVATQGVVIVWAPTVEEMYPSGFATTVSVAGVSEGLCGAARPGHFDGVATVVCKLLNQVQPDVALFGEKDYQQLAVIRQMVTDLNLPCRIVGVPTQRAKDGLALSSRNAYLSPAERQKALILPQTLTRTADRIRNGDLVPDALEDARQSLLDGGFAHVDYVELVDSISLVPVTQLKNPARLLAAARMGHTRLIDNVAVIPLAEIND